MLTVYLHWISESVVTENCLYLLVVMDHRGKELQIVLKAALIWKTLTVLIHTHRPFLNYILAGHRAVLRSDSQQRMRTKFPRSLSGVPSKNNFLFATEWAWSLLPSFHFDATVRLWLPHCHTGDGSNNCLNLNEEKHCEPCNFSFKVFFLLGESRERNMWLNTLSRKKRLDSKFIDK